MFKRCFQCLLYLFLFSGLSSVRAGSYEDFFKSVVNDDAATVSQLLNRGFDPNSRDEKGQNLLYLSLREGAQQVAQVLLAHPQLRIDLVNNAGETALMVAALRDRDTWVARLLDKGARLEGAAGPGRPGWTPLHYAAASPGDKSLLLLLARGAQVDARSPNGTTPLMMAAQYGSEDAVNALLKQGADVRLRNDLDLGPADFARRGGREALASRLAAAAR
jgi:ankyrin repeat protein